MMRNADAIPIQALAVAVLIDREVERFAIGSQRIVRAAELQQQLAEQQAALVQQDRFARERTRLVGQRQRALEAQRRLLGDRCFEIRGWSRAHRRRPRDDPRAAPDRCARNHSAARAMQLASLRLQCRFVDRVAEQRVSELQVDAV